MNARTDYIAGLRALAQLLEDNASLTLPYDGTTSRLGIFVNGPDSITQALLYAQAMDESPTVALNHGSGAWVDIDGRLRGVRVRVYLRADEVCEQGADGEWVIPAELAELAQVDGPPVSIGGDQAGQVGQ